ncbi:unnamed protein product [Notodromas monacha]|uniref:Trans-Golgi network integral membrane protein 2 n=1 Tax=Notodromas monacha TaxID=399045 RepID=A0A7R9BQZ8_9CRUS|nr:unnamed protein product [Notodromas monacha]CAG0920087.1 unnamed protein product [Notodromas monacha]
MIAWSYGSLFLLFVISKTNRVEANPKLICRPEISSKVCQESKHQLCLLTEQLEADICGLIRTNQTLLNSAKHFFLQTMKNVTDQTICENHGFNVPETESRCFSPEVESFLRANGTMCKELCVPREETDFVTLECRAFKVALDTGKYVASLICIGSGKDLVHVNRTEVDATSISRSAKLSNNSVPTNFTGTSLKPGKLPVKDKQRNAPTMDKRQKNDTALEAPIEESTEGSKIGTVSSPKKSSTEGQLITTSVEKEERSSSIGVEKSSTKAGTITSGKPSKVDKKNERETYIPSVSEEKSNSAASANVTPSIDAKIKQKPAEKSVLENESGKVTKPNKPSVNGVVDKFDVDYADKDQMAYGDDGLSDSIDEPPSQENIALVEEKPKKATLRTDSRKPEHNLDSFMNDPRLMRKSMADAQHSDFISYMGFMIVVSALVYLAFINRHKVLALIVEGSRSRNNSERRRSGSGTRYHKLDNAEDSLGSRIRESDDKHVVF